MPGRDDEITIDDLLDAELGDSTQPEPQQASEPDLALGSDIHEVPPPDSAVVDRKPLDRIDAILLAYLMDLDDATVSAGSDASVLNDAPTVVELEPTKPAPRGRR